MTPTDFIHHLEQHPDFLALLEFVLTFSHRSLPMTHRIERTCAGCGSATVEGDFRARINGQLAGPIQSLNDHHTFTLQAPDWTAQGWEISVFHNLWARQLGVLNMTEKDIEIRAWLQKLSPRIESWSSKARIKVNVLPSTIYSSPIQPGVLATSTWVHQAGSELHHWQGQTFVLECTFHCVVVDGEHLLYPAVYAP
ncbi:hypothetical protein C8J57DRAFT_1515326 [Mycena rebaudengoi]|nr:hypothetical protein C8J57DRAFT_1515326 [Mycena rebaudengoi]